MWALSFGDRRAEFCHLEIHYVVKWTHVKFMMNCIGLCCLV